MRLAEGIPGGARDEAAIHRIGFEKRPSRTGGVQKSLEIHGKGARQAMALSKKGNAATLPLSDDI